MSTIKPPKFIAFCFVLCTMLVLLAACGSNTASGTAASPSPTNGTTATATASSNDATGNGRYGSGSKATPTATTAVTGATQTVMITTDSSGSFIFSPKSLTIKVGTTVVWKNTTQTPHTVTSLDANKPFNSGDNTPINSNMTFSFKFTRAGTYKYQCDFHPQTMQAMIIVQ